MDILGISTLAQRRGAVDQAVEELLDIRLVPVTHRQRHQAKGAMVEPALGLVREIMALAAAAGLAQQEAVVRVLLAETAAQERYQRYQDHL